MPQRGLAAARRHSATSACSRSRRAGMRPRQMLERRAHHRRDQRRRRGGIDEGRPRLTRKSRSDRRRQHQRPGRAQRLAAGVQRNDVVAAFEVGAKAAPVRAKDAGGMGLVETQHRVVAVGDRDEIGQTARGRRPCCRGFRPRSTAVPAPPAARQRADRIIDGLRHHCAAPPTAPPCARACPRARWHGSASSWTIRSPRCGRVAKMATLATKPAPKKSARLGAEEGGGLRFQRLMFGMIAAQQPRAAGADRHAARERGSRSLAQARVECGQPEIIVGGEIDRRAPSRSARKRPRRHSASSARS